jgi:hypothetical protein
MRTTTLLLLLFVALLAGGCADANLAEDNLQFCGRDLSGFFWGVWHGIIAPFSFIGSLFKPDIAVYDICNTGGWYGFGFCLGIGAFSKGSHSAARVTAHTSKRGERSSPFSGWWSNSDE